jgi:type III pantothenate kinase
MLLAIDVGNTHTVYGAWDGERWVATWRRSTDPGETEDELAIWLRGLCDLSGLDWRFEGAVCASVVPGLNRALERLGERWLGTRLRFLRQGAEVGLTVQYEPSAAVGADRLANALGALEEFPAPLIVADFGTATTFDVVSASDTYAGGAILPGILVSTEALVQRAAKLPPIEYRPPERAIGRNTTESLQSGIMLGYAGAVDHLVRRIGGELGAPATVLATGGLAPMFMGLCETLQHLRPHLTLDGLRIAHGRLGGG